MKKMLLLTVLLSVCFTGCFNPEVSIKEISDEIESAVSELSISVSETVIKEGDYIVVNYSGVNISECNVSVISEWGEPIVINNSMLCGSELYQCKIKNDLKPGKYYLTFSTLNAKTNTVEIYIVSSDKTPYISKIKEGSSSIKIYGSKFIKGYTPVVICDGQKAEMISFTETCIEIKKLNAGEHLMQVISGEVKSNTVNITTK